MPTYNLLLADGGTLSVDFDESTQWQVVSSLLTETGAIGFLTQDRKVIPLSALTAYLNQIADESLAESVGVIQENLPSAIRPGKKGAWLATATYEEDDLVSYTLPDGRTASYIAIGPVPAGIVPTDTTYWQVYSAPASSGVGSGSGYTLVRLSEQPGSSYAIDVSRESRFIIVLDAAKTISFSNLSSLGNAVVAFQSPASGTIFPLTFTVNPSWTGTPATTRAAGRGDVCIFSCWDGSTVLGTVSDPDVLLSAPSSEFLTGTQALWRFPNSTARLQNYVLPGTNDFTFSDGTNRTPYGIDFVAGQHARTNGLVRLIDGATISFSQPWSLGFVFTDLYSSVVAAQALATPETRYLISLADPVTAANFISVLAPGTGGPKLTVNVRDAVKTNGVVGPRDTGGITGPTVQLPINNRTAHFLVLEYDGAGQYQLHSVGDDVVLYDYVNLQNATNRYISGDTAYIPSFPTMRVSAPPAYRANAQLVGQTIGRLRYAFFIPEQLTLARRREAYTYARNYIAAADPTGTNLPVLT